MMKNKILHIITISLLLFSCGVENNIKKGEKYLAIGEYYDAGEEFKKAYTKTPAKERDKRGEIALKSAFCYQKVNATQKAIAAYKNAIRYNKDNIYTHLSLAKQLLKAGDYKNAAKEYQLVLDSLPENTLAINGLISATNAAAWKKEESGYTVKKQDAFNSRRADFSPLLGGEQYNTLYFTSTRNDATGDELSGITGTKPADIFMSQKDDKGKWTKPELVNGGLNSENEEGTPALSTDGREMYITQCSTDNQYPRYAQIAKSSRSDAAWGKPLVVELSKDTLSSFAHPAISPDGNWIYFISDMPGGQGDLDIWRARITTHGFGGIENLGPKINTPGKEMFPTFRPNGDFYFSSDGHPGLGGLDIFYITKDDGDNIKLVHPGYPLNSHGDDFGMTFDGLQNKGLFSSNRADAGRGWDKIYSFEKPDIIQTVKGWVYEQDGFELTDALVYMVGDNGTNLKISVKGDGSFEQEVTPGVSYILLATCNGFLNHKEEINILPSTESIEHTLQFPLVNIGVPTLINNIFYDFDKATLKPESMTALDKLVELLNENPNITIELSAHCDYRGSESYNKKLSQARAESVCQYLIKKGIKADRLSPVGYGKDKPKTIRKKLTEKYSWLKENDKLTQEFIEKLNQEQQDICNQLNRRTEFIVLRTTYGLFDENGKLKENIEKRNTEQQKQNSNDFFFNMD